MRKKLALTDLQFLLQSNNVRFNSIDRNSQGHVIDLIEKYSIKIKDERENFNPGTLTINLDENDKSSLLLFINELLEVEQKMYSIERDKAVEDTKFALKMAEEILSHRTIIFLDEIGRLEKDLERIKSGEILVVDGKRVLKKTYLRNSPRAGYRRLKNKIDRVFV